MVLLTCIYITFAWLLLLLESPSSLPSLNLWKLGCFGFHLVSIVKQVKMLPWSRNNQNIVGLLTRHFATKPKPKMKPIELNTPPEQTQTITRVIFDVLKEHGPLTIAETWDRVKEVGLRGLTSKRHMKIILRWMRERQKLKLICNHVGPHKQFLYTTWFTKHNPSKLNKLPENLTGKSSGHPKLP